jgi:hypothetical protein
MIKLIAYFLLFFFTFPLSIIFGDVISLALRIDGFSRIVSDLMGMGFSFGFSGLMGLITAILVKKLE